MAKKSIDSLHKKLKRQFCLDSESISGNAEIYKEKFPEVDLVHIKILLTYISSLIVRSFNPSECSTPQDKRGIAKIIKDLSNCTVEERTKSSNVNTLYWLNKRADHIDRYLERNGYVPAENSEIYLPLVNAITEEIGETVANTVSNSVSEDMSYVERYSSSDQGPARKKHSPDKVRDLTWVEKVTTEGNSPEVSKK